MKLLIGLLFAYIVFLILENLYKQIWDKGLSVDINFSKNTAVEGESIKLFEVITNRKFLPLSMLKVRFYTHKNIKFDDGENAALTDKNYRADVFTIFPYQKITRILPFLCSKRGFYTIGDVNVTSSDPLMSLTLIAAFETDTTLLIYPKGVDIARLEIPFSKIIGMIIANRFSYEDPFEFRTIRNYESFDSMKNVNWKASAKTGNLLVNAHNYTLEQEVCLLLDLDSDTTVEDEGLKEESLQIASSLCEMIISQGIPLSMYTNGRDMITKENLFCARGCGEQHIFTVKECLARIDLSLSQTPFIENFPKISAKFSDNVVPILITPSKTEELAELFSSTFRKNSVWILTHRPNDKIDVNSANCCQFIPWEVSY